MYHVAVVDKLYKYTDKGLYSAENTTQALVKMWDDGILTVMVHPMLNDKIKEHDFVLIRFAQPEETIVKILPKKTGEALRDQYKKFIENKKQSEQPKQKIRLEVPKIQKLDGQEQFPMSGMVR